MTASTAIRGYLLLAFSLSAIGCTYKSETCQPAPGESCGAYVRDNEEACDSAPECTWLPQCARISCATQPSSFCIADKMCDWDDETQLCTRTANVGPDACATLGFGGSSTECSEALECFEPRCVTADGQRMCHHMSLSECDANRRCEVVTKHRPIFTTQ